MRIFTHEEPRKGRYKALYRKVKDGFGRERSFFQNQRGDEEKNMVRNERAEDREGPKSTI
jgi:hypothetical protein